MLFYLYFHLFSIQFPNRISIHFFILFIIFQFFFPGLSHEYHVMWSQHYTGIEAAYRPEDVLYIRYEDLKNEKIRVEVGI